MTKVIPFPLNQLSDKDKKIISLETFIKSNLMQLAETRRELILLSKRLEGLSNLEALPDDNSKGRQ